MCGMVGLLLSSRFHGRLSERTLSLAATSPLRSALGINGLQDEMRPAAMCACIANALISIYKFIAVTEFFLNRRGNGLFICSPSALNSFDIVSSFSNVRFKHLTVVCG